MSTEKSCLRYIERSILDTARLYGIEEVAQGETLCFPQMAGWFEGEKIGGDFLVRVNQTAENSELILGTMMGFVSQLTEFLGLAPISAQTGISAKSIETLFSQNKIFNTNSRDNDKNNIKFMIEELPLAEISVLDQEILLRVMTQKPALQNDGAADRTS